MENKNLEFITKEVKDTFWSKLHKLFIYKGKDTKGNIPLCGICGGEMINGGYNGQECSEECYKRAMQISYK